MKAEIISVGTELLMGEITDTNSSYLASELPPLGIDLQWISSIDDNIDKLVEVLRRAWERSELILLTGGLGPTEDDLTREGIAKMLGEKMEISPSLEKVLRERFTQRVSKMPLSNLKQATLIPSAKPITNARGTAPGWWVEKDGCLLISMPGPPAELHEMWEKEVQPRLRQRSNTIILSRTIKTFGLSESIVGEMVAPLFSIANPILGIYAKVDGIHLRFIAKAESRGEAERMIAEGEAIIRKCLSENIWGVDNDTLETVVARLLIERGLSVAVMEDYTGGCLTTIISDIPENLEFFRGSLVAHSNEAKIALGVKNEVISQYGAVSPEVAQTMAETVRARLGADIGVSITGIAEASRPAGMVYIGIADGKNNESREVSGRTTLVKRRVATATLFELRKWLIQKG